ncbi:MAG: hypothetical protein WC451_04230 [Patescibacteria group bacterium]
MAFCEKKDLPNKYKIFVKIFPFPMNGEISFLLKYLTGSKNKTTHREYSLKILKTKSRLLKKKSIGLLIFTWMQK